MDLYYTPRFPACKQPPASSRNVRSGIACRQVGGASARACAPLQQQRSLADGRMQPRGHGVPQAMSRFRQPTSYEAQDTSSSGGQVPLPSPSNVTYKEGEFVEVGQVMGAFGVRGEVRIAISTDSPKKRFGVAGKTLYLREPPKTGLLARLQQAQEPGLIKVTTSGAKVRVLPKGEEAWIVSFKEIHDRSQAEQLQSYTVHIPVAERERLRDPDEFWVQDLAGCEVFLKTTGEYVGVVIDVLSGFGTHDTLLIQLKLSADDIESNSMRQCMIPFVKQIVPEVDTQLRQIEVDPPEGLLDMATVQPLKRKLTDKQKEQRLEMVQMRQVPIRGKQTPPELAAVLTLKPRPGSKKQATSDSSASTSSGPSSSAPAASTLNSSSSGGASRRRPASSSGSTQDEGSPGRGAAAQASASREQQRGRLRSSTKQVVQEEVESDSGDEESDVEESDESEGGSAPAQGSTERWKLRRRLGASLAGRKSRL